jgi:hypothetical protein
LITAHGSEALAVEALEQGATSYVPKALLAEKLVETVEQVLAVSKADRSYSRLIECLEATQYAFALRNDPALIPPLVDLMQQVLAGMGCCNTTQRMHVGIALEEALLNGVLLGNLELDRQQAQEARRLLRQGMVAPLVDQRCGERPYCDRVARLTAEISREKATFVVRDEGPGFDLSVVPNRRDPDVLEQGVGRGLVLIKNFMDDVWFNEKGNEITMVIQCDGDS